MGKMDEAIIVVPRAKVFADETLTFQGVERAEPKLMFINNNIADNYTTMRRGDAEENADFKQPIPYCIIRRGSQVFMYKRLSGGGESRLHDKLSIGAGGHMNAIDGVEDFNTILQVNLERELEEELAIENKYRMTTIGFINDDSELVSRVHIGLLTVLELRGDGTVEVRETDQLEGEWISIEDLKKPEIYDRLESWSQIATTIL